jgi:hypothetical protein
VWRLSSELLFKTGHAVQIITRNIFYQQNVFRMLWNDSPQNMSLQLKDCSIAANHTAIITLYVQLHHV